TDRQQHALGGAGVGAGVLLAELEVLLQGIFFLPGGFEPPLEMAENRHRSPRSLRCPGRPRCAVPAIASVSAHVKTDPARPRSRFPGAPLLWMACKQG